MKHTKHKKQPDARTQSQRVHFEFSSPAAESVFIAGTFNDWRPEATPMIPLDQGRWAQDLHDKRPHHLFGGQSAQGSHQDGCIGSSSA